MTALRHLYVLDAIWLCPCSLVGKTLTPDPSFAPACLLPCSQRRQRHLHRRPCACLPRLSAGQTRVQASKAAVSGCSTRLGGQCAGVPHLINCPLLHLNSDNPVLPCFAAGIAGCWADRAVLQLLHDAVTPPSANLQLVQWSRQPELLQASKPAGHPLVRV